MTHPGLDIGPLLGGRAELDFLAGLIAGFAASLHCLTMCSGIAAAIGAAGSDRPVLARARTVSLASAGRIAVYVALGAIAGWLGQGFQSAAPPEAARLLARYLSAVVLLIAALTVLEIPLFGGRLGQAAARLAGPMTRRLHRLHRLGAVGLGLAWGLVPCAMVYVTTFYAGLSGSAAQGALVMAGFGLGTAPAMIAAGAGAGALAALTRASAARWVAAAALVVLAGVTAAGV
ncbi:MAG: sulfite exporter TauE/SafE family protein [Oceanicaulis sp.]